MAGGVGPAPNSTPSDAGQIGHGGRAPPATAASVGYESPSSSSEPLSDPSSAEMVGGRAMRAASTAGSLTTRTEGD